MHKDSQNWLIKQHWSNTLFYHFKMDPDVLQKYIPFPLDIYEQDAYLSIVPFCMSNISFRFCPQIIYPSKLWELNLRTYVKVNGIAGIYFITLDANDILASLVANTYFSLPYRLSSCHISLKENQEFHFSHRRFQDRKINFSTSFHVKNKKMKTDLDHWLTERYSLFTYNQWFNKVYRGQVSHKPWDLYNVDITSMNDNFSKQVDQYFERGQIISASFCPSMKVSFSPFECIDTNIEEL